MRYFNPRGPCGPRRRGTGKTYGSLCISILAVLADRDNRLPQLQIHLKNFNPRGPCGPRHPDRQMGKAKSKISILAVLADRDVAAILAGELAHLISILAVLADRDAPWCRWQPPAWRYFNPRGPCGPRHGLAVDIARINDFNPRGPCGPRRPQTQRRPGPHRFQSSRSLRTATYERSIPG